MANPAEQARYDAAAESVKANERKMFGCEVSFIDKQFEQAFSKGMYIMGILSDVQEAMAREQYETARQWTNKAKYLMTKVLPRDAEGRML